MSTVAELKRLLGEFKAASNVEAAAIVSRNGIPIAWEMPESAHIETFATLSATILGASEVVFSGLNKELPDRVIVESRGITLIAIGLGTRALLVALSSAADMKAFRDGMEDTANKIKEVLKHEKGKL